MLPSLRLWRLRSWFLSGSTTALKEESHSGDNVLWFEPVGCGMHGLLRRRWRQTPRGLRLQLIIVLLWSLKVKAVAFANDGKDLSGLFLQSNENFISFFIAPFHHKLTGESVVKTCATTLLCPVSVVVTYPNTFRLAESRTTQHTLPISWDATKSCKDTFLIKKGQNWAWLKNIPEDSHHISVRMRDSRHHAYEWMD